jgi:hypothetical protein
MLLVGVKITPPRKAALVKKLAKIWQILVNC